MWNKDYEAEKAKYVDSMIFRILELEAENEFLKGAVNSNKAGALNAGARYAISPKEAELRENLDSANKKYRMITQQYAELKAAYDANNPEVSGLRKVAKWYVNYGFIGILKKIWGKIKRG